MGDNSAFEQGIPNPDLINRPDSHPPNKEHLGTPCAVFRTIKREFAGEVTARGILTKNNHMATLAPELEAIFSEAARTHGKPERENCILAFPRDPRHEKQGLSYDPQEELLVKIQVDPKRAFVTDGEKYTEAGIRLKDERRKEDVVSWADSYYEDTMPLEEYLLKHHGQEDDYGDFNFPEVHIPYDITPDKIEVIG